MVSYNLVPSLFRNDVYKEESRIYHDVITVSPDSFNSCLNSFEQLVVLQHYGLPTRLLDLTTNPLVALFFACEGKNNKKENAVVHYFDLPYSSILYYDNPLVQLIGNKALSLYEKEYNSTDYENIIKSQFGIHVKYEDFLKSIICVKPRLNNPRIIRQSGAFFLYGDINYNDIFNMLKGSSIEIANNYIDRVLNELSVIGISKSTMYPEIQNIAEEVKSKYK